MGAYGLLGLLMSFGEINFPLRRRRKGEGVRETALKE